MLHCTCFRRVFAPLLASLLVASGAGVRAGEVEVLHYWTSGGEAKSLAELKGLMAQRGHSWKDFAVVGGGGQNAMDVLKARVLAGNPPAAANIKGPAIQEWAALGALTNLDAMASFDRWDEVLPKVVADQMKHKGR
jgi:glucose/mannose transport system substrate-binding protein